MPAEKPPAFQFYPKDFLTDEKVVRMSNTEVGIYVRLLCYCWLEGSLPLETEALAHFAHVPIKQFTRLWEHSVVKTCFQVSEDGRLHHKRLDGERQKQSDYKRRQSDAGRASAEGKRATGGQPKVNQMPTTTQPAAVCLVEPEVKSSLSSLQSSSPVSGLQTPVSPPVSAIIEEDVSLRGGRLVERYGELFIEHRHGARYRSRPNLDWQDACDLCRVWDDARLEKLAVLVLTTDDRFISSTDRSFKIFAMKASWADDKLRQWEIENELAV